jgi:hypothetical protein
VLDASLVGTYPESSPNISISISDFVRILVQHYDLSATCLVLLPIFCLLIAAAGHPLYAIHALAADPASFNQNL